MGHVNPTLALGSELLQRGHQVAWISLDPALESRLPPGGSLLPVKYETRKTPGSERKKEGIT